MKKITKSILAILCCMLLHTQVHCDIYTDAIATLDSDVRGYISALSKNSNQNIVNLLNKIFVNTPSILDLKFKQTIKDFLAVYTLRKDFSSINFATIDATNTASLKTLLAKEIGYNIHRNPLEKTNDLRGLLLLPFEGTLNDFDTSTVNSGPDSTPYRSLGDSNTVKIAADIDAPNLSDLLGVDGYADDNIQNRAKLFISYVLQAVQPPKNFNIPDKATAKSDPNNPANQVVYMYLPYPDKDAGTPYTAKKISLSPNSAKYANIPAGESNVEYTRMLNYLKSDTNLYQPYKIKVRMANVLRTLYTESLYRAYQERIRSQDSPSSPSLSLVEKEKLLALSGLDAKYYSTLINGDPTKNLSPATLADLAIEGLKAINKLGYFIYRIHQDIERLTIIASIGNMSLTANLTGAQDNISYVKPIANLIKNNCWDQNVPNLLTSDQKKICANPKSVQNTADDAV